MKLRTILLIGLVATGAFAVGAIWAEKRAWPYEWLRNQKPVAALIAKLVRPGPVIDTIFAPLELKLIDLGVEFSAAGHAGGVAMGHGGGIFAYDDNVIIMSVAGGFYLHSSVNGERSVSKLAIRLDIGFEAFLDFQALNRLPTGRAIRDFRFIDLIYRRDSSPPFLLVSHHQWHREQECFTLRVSKLELDPDQPLRSASATTVNWQGVYDPIPCLGMKTRHHPFAGSISGGRIVFEDETSVLLSVGDHQFDGLNSDHIHAQDTTSDYGKIIRIDLSSGTAAHVSRGNRNPQGLMIDGDGRIWSTEHGPLGGDELNVIEPGANYGWPRVTYGAQYGQRTWPLSENQNRHDGFARPVFAWYRSVSVSELIQIHGFLPEWDGDLLVSTLGEKTLHRLRYRDGRVIFDESIRVGYRIRDLDQLADGTIVMWTDDPSILELRPATGHLHQPGVRPARSPSE